MPALVLLFFIADCALVVPYLVAWKIGGLYWKLGALVDLGGKANLVSWYSSMQLFLIAALLGVFAYYKLERRNKASWLLPVLPIVFAAMSFEEIADIHDWLAYKSAVLFPVGFFARDMLYYRDLALIGGPALAALLAALGVCLRQYLRGTTGIATKYVVGLTVLVACGVDVFPAAAGGARRVLQVSLQELGQMVGMTLMLWATHDLLAAHEVSLPAPAPRSLGSTAPIL